MIRLRDISIGKRMFVAFSGCAAITLLVAGLGYYGAVTYDAAMEDVGLVKLPSVESLQNLALALGNMETADEQLCSVSANSQTRKVSREDGNRAKKQADEAWAVYEPLPQTAEEAMEWKKFVPAWDKWWTERKAYLAAVQEFETLGVNNPNVLDRDLTSFRLAHYQLQLSLLRSIVTGDRFDGGDDHSSCVYGKWLAALKSDSVKLRSYFESTRASHQRTHELAREVKAFIAKGEKDKALKLFVGEFQQAFGQTMANFDQAGAFVAEANQARATMQRTMEAADAASAPVEQSLARLVSINAVAAKNAVETAEGQANWLKGLSLAAMFGSVALALGLGVVISRSIVPPIRRTVDMLKDISQGEGDLTKRLTADGRDEVGHLAQYFNQFVEKLQGIISRLTADVGTVASSATELSATASQLAGGAEETTNQSAQVAAAAEEMSVNMTSMAAASEEMSTNVKTVSAAVEQLTASVGEMAKSSERAASAAANATQLVDTSNSQIGELGGAADEIGKVIEVIQDIAEQTNLLALNATIEAARAGEAGKGFAVVATEVKELAKQTATATEDIRRRIEGIQGSAESTVRSMGGIGDVIRQVSDLSRIIASAVEEQSITTKEIARNMAQSSTAANTVAKGVAESATASQEIARIIVGVDQSARQAAQGATQTQVSGQELSVVAEHLRSLVGQFKV